MKLKNCCFCIDLKTGSLVIAYITLLTVTVDTLLNYEKVEEVRIIHAEAGDVAHLELGIAKFMIVLTWVVTVIINVVLIVGIYKKNQSMINAYLILYAICIPLGIIGIIYGLVKGLGTTFNNAKNIIEMLFHIFGYVVIRSYYYKIKVVEVDEEPKDYSKSESC